MVWLVHLRWYLEREQGLQGPQGLMQALEQVSKELSRSMMWRQELLSASRSVSPKHPMPFVVLRYLRYHANDESFLFDAVRFNSIRVL